MRGHCRKGAVRVGGATRSKRVPRVVREQQMLDAAVRAFARCGYQHASMDDIAELAGVSKPLVYLYLNSKEELFAACLRREAALLVAAVRGAVERGAPPDRQLWSGLSGFFAHTARHPDGWALLHVQARTQRTPLRTRSGGDAGGDRGVRDPADRGGGAEGRAVAGAADGGRRGVRARARAGRGGRVAGGLGGRRRGAGRHLGPGGGGHPHELRLGGAREPAARTGLVARPL
ncbi:LOW QUALITY PROTEIN: TetR-family regulatory protein, partial [Streptomyces himastatinicus ATCC 53653]